MQDQASGVPPRRKTRLVQVIEGSNNGVFRVAPSILARNNAVPTNDPRNERDDKDCVDESESSRQTSSALVSTAKQRKGIQSFEETSTSFATDEGEGTDSFDISGTTSRDSVSLSSFDSADLPLLKLENVTLLSRSLISPALLSQRPPLHPKKEGRKNMATPAVTNNGGGNGDGQKQSRKGMFRKRISMKRNSTQENSPLDEDPLLPRQPPQRSATESNVQAPVASLKRSSSDPKLQRNLPSQTEAAAAATPQRSNIQRKTPAEENNAEPEPAPRRGMLERIRSASRSRSRARSKTEVAAEMNKPILVAVTSCRSDAYYNQKAPGSTSKLPRKAPSNLKLFHELAVGIKDAYAAVGQTPTRPEELQQGETKPNAQLLEGRTVLWEFIGNLDFVSTPDENRVDFLFVAHLIGNLKALGTCR